MLNEVIKFLQPSPGQIVVDATLGGGGHAEAILKKLLPGGKLIGLDQDNDAIEAAQRRLFSFGRSFQAVKANFRKIAEVCAELQLEGIDGLLFDLGVSSYQLDCRERGFSYSEDVFLDMRMDRELPQSAADLLGVLPERQLAGIFRDYGEEKWANRIAAFIVKYRQEKGPVLRSKELVEIIRNAVPAAARRRGGHPAKRVFQALRIAVNEELESLKSGLYSGLELLRPGGRLAVLSYHSLEDVIVKKILREQAQSCICPAGLPLCSCGKIPRLKVLTKKPVYPTEEEIIANPRARSARLRAAEKLGILS